MRAISIDKWYNPWLSNLRSHCLRLFVCILLPIYWMISRSWRDEFKVLIRIVWWWNCWCLMTRYLLNCRMCRMCQMRISDLFVRACAMIAWRWINVTLWMSEKWILSEATRSMSAEIIHHLDINNVTALRLHSGNRYKLVRVTLYTFLHNNSDIVASGK